MKDDLVLVDDHSVACEVIVLGVLLRLLILFVGVENVWADVVAQVVVVLVHSLLNEISKIW